MEQVEQLKQSFLDFMMQNSRQHNSFPSACNPSDESSAALSKSLSSVVHPSVENVQHYPKPAHSSSNPCVSSSESCPLLKEHDYTWLAEVSSTSTSDVADTDLHLGLGWLEDDYSGQRRVLPIELELLEPREKSTMAVQGSQDAPASGLTSAGVPPPTKNGVKRALAEARPSVNMTSGAFKQAQGSGESEQQNMFVSCQPAPISNSVHPNTCSNARLDDLERYNSALLEPPAKGQVVGWPPIRSYRRNTLSASHTQPAIDGEGQSAVFVKVNMDGIPIGRKVDLNTCCSYESLKKALEEMFYNPSSGSCPQFLSSGVFVLTYEDKEGDWMLVGDVPWGMFVNSVRRLRIVRGSEATGLASRG